MLQRSIEQKHSPLWKAPRPAGFPEDKWQDAKEGIIRRADEAELRLRQLRQDPDSFDFGTDDFSLLLVYFTFAPRQKTHQVLSGLEIACEPTFRVALEIATPRTTVNQAVERTMAEGIPVDTYNELVEHGNSPLNITNRPEHMDDALRLVFNLMCYLNLRDREVEERLPNDRLQAKLANATTEKARNRILSKAHSEGIRHVQFCGYQSFRGASAGDGKSPVSHWRRGHWRNQVWGKNRTERKLVWIRPVLVGKNAEEVPAQRIYDVDR